MIQLSPATHYFIEYWSDLWTGISSKRDLLKSFNPRVVIQELRDEITLNKQRNISNEKFFTRILGGYVNTDPGSKARLRIHLQMILTELNVSKHRPKYLPLLCDSALSAFTKFEYFEDCLVAMVELTKAESISLQQKRAIQSIVNHLIVELRCIGYTDEEIRKIPMRLFTKVEKINGTVFWEFPYPQHCEDWKNAQKVKAFEAELLAYQDTLKETDRIFALLTIAKQTAKPIRFIFPVNGMVGTMSLNIGEVSFYSPAHEQYVVEGFALSGGRKDEEWFTSQEGSNVVNATVIVDALNPQAGEPIARSRVEKAFALCRRILNGKSTLWLGKSHIALDENGSVISINNHTFERSEDDFTQRINLHSESQPKLETRLNQIEQMQAVSKANGWGRRFDEACYWLRKAEETSNHVEQLLSYWICIETLCAKSDNDTANWFQTKSDEKETDIYLIREVVGKTVALGKCYEFGWLIHEMLSSPTAKWNEIHIPLPLLKKAQLNREKGQITYLINLINNLNEVEQLVPNGMLKDQICHLREFYSDKNVTLTALKKYLETAQDELAFIYRMRNKIAHDGNSEHFLLPSLCKLAAHYAKSFFNQVQQYVEKEGDTDLKSILIKIVQKYDRIELLLKTEEPVTILLGQSASTS